MRRSAGRDVTINCLESLSSAFSPPVHDLAVAHDTGLHELKKVKNRSCRHTRARSSEHHDLNLERPGNSGACIDIGPAHIVHRFHCKFV